MTSSSVTSCKKAISMFNEDSVQIPTQKSWILCFCWNGPVKHLNAHQLATFVQTTWQYHPDAHQCLEVSNSLRLHPSVRHCNMSGHSSVFDKKSDFLLRHRYGKTAASVRMTGQHHLDVILDKGRRGEELQPSGHQSNIPRTRSLLWYLYAVEVQPSGC
jgi:hypothetical protein